MCHHGYHTTVCRASLNRHPADVGTAVIEQQVLPPTSSGFCANMQHDCLWCNLHYTLLIIIGFSELVSVHCFLSIYSHCLYAFSHFDTAWQMMYLVPHLHTVLFPANLSRLGIILVCPRQFKAPVCNTS